VHGQFGFDATLLQSAGLDKSERVDFTLDPMGQKVYVLRVLASAAGKSTQVQVDGLSAAGSSGAPIPVKIEGDLALEFAAR